MKKSQGKCYGKDKRPSRDTSTRCPERKPSVVLTRRLHLTFWSIFQNNEKKPEGSPIQKRLSERCQSRSEAQQSESPRVFNNFGLSHFGKCVKHVLEETGAIVNDLVFLIIVCHHMPDTNFVLDLEMGQN